jgi:hypothetical protein
MCFWGVLLWLWWKSLNFLSFVCVDLSKRVGPSSLDLVGANRFRLGNYKRPLNVWPFRFHKPKYSDRTPWPSFLESTKNHAITTSYQKKGIWKTAKKKSRSIEYLSFTMNPPYISVIDRPSSLQKSLSFKTHGHWETSVAEICSAAEDEELFSWAKISGQNMGRYRVERYFLEP